MKDGGELVNQVRRAIDDDDYYNEWFPATARGGIGAIEFLGVILWALRDGPTDRDDKIVADWSSLLLAATRHRSRSGFGGVWRQVQPFDPVSSAPISSEVNGWDWSLAIDDADDFLRHHGMGFDCSTVLNYWRGVPWPSEEVEPNAKAERVAEAAKQDEWTNIQLATRHGELERGHHPAPTKQLLAEAGLLPADPKKYNAAASNLRRRIKKGQDEIQKERARQPEKIEDAWNPRR